MPWGKETKTMKLKNIEMQGSVNSPMRCSMTVDTLGKTFLSNKKLSNNLYKFRGFLPIPPLSMVDDVLMISKCGIESLIINECCSTKQI